MEGQRAVKLFSQIMWIVPSVVPDKLLVLLEAVQHTRTAAPDLVLCRGVEGLVAGRHSWRWWPHILSQESGVALMATG